MILNYNYSYYLFSLKDLLILKYDFDVSINQFPDQIFARVSCVSLHISYND